MQLSVKDAAGLLNVSEDTVYEWVKRNEIPSHTINEDVRFNRSELLEWATARNIQISPDLFSVTVSGKSSLPSLSNALREGGVVYGISGTDPASVLRAVVDTLVLPPEMDREFLYQILLAREDMGSTGVGDGIAIPHVRNPVVLHVSQPTVTLCFLKTPIDFQAVDGKPVNILFTLISPTVKTHLHLLSRLGFVLRNRDVKSALKREASQEEILTLIASAETAAKPLSGGPCAI